MCAIPNKKWKRSKPRVTLIICGSIQHYFGSIDTFASMLSQRFGLEMKVGKFKGRKWWGSIYTINSWTASKSPTVCTTHLPHEDSRLHSVLHFLNQTVPTNYLRYLPI